MDKILQIVSGHANRFPVEVCNFIIYYQVVENITIRFIPYLTWINDIFIKKVGYL